MFNFNFNPMKKVLFLLLFFCSFLSNAQSLVQVGTFNAGNEKYPLYLYGVIVQKTPDGKALVPRGGNFLTNSMVSSNYTNLSDLLVSTHTGFGGIEQPEDVPLPHGYYEGYLYDKNYDVVSRLFVKIGETIDGLESKELAYARKKKA